VGREIESHQGLGRLVAFYIPKKNMASKPRLFPPRHRAVTDLRKALVKTRLAECVAAAAGLDRSDSLDSILSESLLDPPPKVPPKRYQSPSRCGSPSLEAPDHLLFRGKSRMTSSSQF
jgi:hypothetical protein